VSRPTSRHVFYSLKDHFGNNASISDSCQANTLQRFSEICAKYRHIEPGLSLFLIVAALLAGCQSGSESAVTAEPETELATRCGAEGYLETELFGGLSGQLQWNAADLDCAGMPRPDGDGARLRFAAEVGDGVQLAFILALPELQRGKSGKELRTTVTLIEEGNGRFFSSADLEICWTDITQLSPIDGSSTNFSIGGNLYCVAPLTQVNGDSDVLIRDLVFRGLLDWEAS
jgi:hypothetical protein